MVDRDSLLEREGALAALSGWVAGVRAAGWPARVRLRRGGCREDASVAAFLRARHGPARVLWGSCDPLFTPRPLGPLVDIAQVTGGELGELVQREARPHEVAAALLARACSRGCRRSSSSRMCTGRTRGRSTCCVCSVGGCGATPALVIASYRDDALDRDHPLRVVLGELATGDAAARLRLQPLSAEAVARLAEPHGVDGDELYRATRPAIRSSSARCWRRGPGDVPPDGS